MRGLLAAIGIETLRVQNYVYQYISVGIHLIEEKRVLSIKNRKTGKKRGIHFLFCVKNCGINFRKKFTGNRYLSYDTYPGTHSQAALLYFFIFPYPGLEFALPG
jgi:hypothetical protein